MHATQKFLRSEIPELFEKFRNGTLVVPVNLDEQHGFVFLERRRGASKNLHLVMFDVDLHDGWRSMVDVVESIARGWDRVGRATEIDQGRPTVVHHTVFFRW